MALAQVIFSAFFYLLAILLARCIIVYSYRILLHPLSKYPGPSFAKVSDWYGALHALRKDLHVATFTDHQRYGSVVRQGPNKLIFNSVTALHDIYHNDKLFKSQTYRVTQSKPDIASILSVLDKGLHRIKRKLISAGLSERNLRRFEPSMLAHVDIFIQQLRDASRSGDALEMTTKIKYLGLDISSQFGFGSSLDMQTSSQNRFLTRGMEGAIYRSYVYMQFPMAQYLGVDIMLLKPLFGIRKEYREWLKDMIARRRAIGSRRGEDLFSYVAEAKDTETKDGMSEMELFAEAEFFLPAGGQTTSSAITALLFYLSQNPNSYMRLAQEIRSRFTTGAEIVSGQKLSSCSFLRACIDEALRLSPPICGTLWRELPLHSSESHVVIDGNTIPKGISVGVNIYSIHHNEKYFRDPFKFNPERWIRADQTDEQWKLMHDAFNPFSIGTRSCAGKAMAYMEISLVIAKMMWYFDFESVNKAGNGDNPLLVGRKIGKDEFPMDDQLITTHEGPYLKLTLARNE